PSARPGSTSRPHLPHPGQRRKRRPSRHARCRLPRANSFPIDDEHPLPHQIQRKRRSRRLLLSGLQTPHRRTRVTPESRRHQTRPAKTRPLLVPITQNPNPSPRILATKEKPNQEWSTKACPRGVSRRTLGCREGSIKGIYCYGEGCMCEGSNQSRGNLSLSLYNRTSRKDSRTTRPKNTTKIGNNSPNFQLWQFWQFPQFPTYQITQLPN